MKKISEPLSLFLIGVTGDLAKKKILKAVYKLYADNLLPTPFTLVGNARQGMSRAEFQEFVRGVVSPADPANWQTFAENLHYVSGDATEAATFAELGKFHRDLQHEHHCGNHIWYIATHPRLYLDIARNLRILRAQSMTCGWTKVLIEKPFGTNLASARALNQELSAVFTEDEIYRIDHFLGKETVQNLLAFRFANGLFEELWNRNFIDHVQVTFAETLGVEGREEFYNATGATRDVVQNHLLQMIAITMMEEPKSLNPEDIRLSRSQLLESLCCFEQGDMAKKIAFAQFAAGNINGKAVDGFFENPLIPKDSSTETAVAVKLEINNDRWEGVPIYVRTGKRMATDVLEISVQFKDPKNAMFRGIKYGPDPNVLTFRFQPNESIFLRLFVKKPGHGIELDMVPMTFNYHHQYQMNFVEAYERLIYDASIGDPTLFPDAKSIEASWRVVDEVLAHKSEVPMSSYPAGSWGPAAFQELIEQDGRRWIDSAIQDD